MKDVPRIGFYDDVCLLPKGVPAVTLPASGAPIQLLQMAPTGRVDVFDFNGRLIHKLKPGESQCFERQEPKWWQFWVLRPRWRKISTARWRSVRK